MKKGNKFAVLVLDKRCLRLDIFCANNIMCTEESVLVHRLHMFKVCRLYASCSRFESLQQFNLYKVDAVIKI